MAKAQAEQLTDLVGKNGPMVRVGQLAENMAICMVVPLGDPNDSTSTRGAVPLYWGKPGIGKSAIAAQAAQLAMLSLETIYPATKNPEEFSSITIPDPKSKDGLRAVAQLPQVRRLMAKKEGVLFFDEASGAPPAVQSATLSVFQERNIGDEKLPPGVRLMAAANPIDCAAGGWDLEPPTANRFLHFEVPPPNKDEWLRWYMSESTPSIPPVDSLWDTVAKNWASSYARAKQLIAGWIGSAAGAQTLYMLPSEDSPQRSRAWPSSRTWDVAGRCIGTLLALKKEALMGTFVEAAVGDGAASQFMTWVRTADMPTAEQMLEHGFKPDKHRLDFTLAALLGMTEFVVQHPDKKIYAAPAWSILEKCLDVGLTDLVMSSASTLVRAGLAEEELGDAVVQAAKPVIRHFASSPTFSVMVGKP